MSSYNGLKNKLTLDEANNIMYFFGVHLEYAGGLNILFTGSIPESLLPYPKILIQEALNIMINFFNARNQLKEAETLSFCLGMLSLYHKDEEAIGNFIEKCSNTDLKKDISFSLKERQLNQICLNGFLLSDKKHWSLSEERLEELLS